MEGDKNRSEEDATANGKMLRLSRPDSSPAINSIVLPIAESIVEALFSEDLTKKLRPGDSFAERTSLPRDHKSCCTLCLDLSARHPEKTCGSRELLYTARTAQLVSAVVLVFLARGDSFFIADRAIVFCFLRRSLFSASNTESRARKRDSLTLSSLNFLPNLREPSSN